MNVLVPESLLKMCFIYHKKGIQLKAVIYSVNLHSFNVKAQTKHILFILFPKNSEYGCSLKETINNINICIKAVFQTKSLTFISALQEMIHHSTRLKSTDDAVGRLASLCVQHRTRSRENNSQNSLRSSEPRLKGNTTGSSP